MSKRRAILAQPRLIIVPLPLDEANEFVRQHHRHHQPVVGHRFSLGVADETGTVRGVAIVGRPTARRLDDGLTLEVTRLATDGCPNACSSLYSAAWRAAKAMGYRKIVTFTLDSEPGTSLKAAGWRVVHSTPGKSWSVPSRPRVDKHPLQQRFRWEQSADSTLIPVRERLHSDREFRDAFIQEAVASMAFEGQDVSLDETSESLDRVLSEPPIRLVGRDDA